MNLKIALLCSMSVLLSSSAFADAMLVYDPANYAQNVNTALYTYQMTQQFTQQLGYLTGKQYSTLLGQLTQLQNTYTLHTTNLTGYTNLSKLLPNNTQVINAYHGDADYAMLQSLNSQASNYAQQRDAILSEYYHAPENPQQVSQDLGDVLPSDAVSGMTDEASLHQKNWQRVLDAQEIAAKQNQTQVEREQQLDNFSQAVSTLGDKTQLQTEQLTAAEVHLLLQQQEEQTTSLAALQQAQVNEMAKETSAESEDFENEQQRLKAAANQGTSGYGQDTWGNF